MSDYVEPVRDEKRYAYHVYCPLLERGEKMESEFQVLNFEWMDPEAVQKNVKEEVLL